MPALSNRDRKYKDIYDYVQARLSEQVRGVQKYRYEAVMEMAAFKFYLTPERIAEIVRDYEPPPPPPADPTQIPLNFDQP